MSVFFNDRTDSPRWGVISFLVILVIIILGILSFLGKWFDTSVEVFSPDNVMEQHHAIIQDWESLQVSANNACAAQDAVVGSKSPTLVEDPAMAYAATYRNVVADYNRRMTNLFEANLVAPSGYPDAVPSLDMGPTTDWCSVAIQLNDIK